ncbi:MAG: hypothetical protein AB2L07_18925 [Thermoanaerobaculaceae bacterium]
METLDLGTVVAGATTLVRRLLREQTRLELSLASRPAAGVGRPRADRAGGGQPGR